MSSLFSDKQKIKTAQRLKALREERSISHATLSRELLEKCGLSISKDSLIKYEVDDIHHSSFGATKGMGSETLYCLAKYYNVATDYLLGNSDIRTPNPQMQAACEYTGLSEQAIITIKNLEKGSDAYDSESPSYMPPLLKTLNTLYENGFMTELVKAFAHFLFRISPREETANWFLRGSRTEHDENVILPEIWRLNKEIDNAIDSVLKSLWLELENSYMGWEEPQ